MGSAFAPAPAQHKTGMPRRLHAASSDTCGTDTLNRPLTRSRALAGPSTLCGDVLLLTPLEAEGGAAKPRQRKRCSLQVPFEATF